MRRALLIGALLFLGAPAYFAMAATAELQPAETLKQVTVQRVPAWQTEDQITFAAPTALLGSAKPGPLYVKIVYLDRGQGLLCVAYRSTDGMVRSETHTRSSRVGTGHFVASYDELLRPSPDDIPDSPWLKIRVDGSDGTPLTIRSVTVRDDPFPDPGFQEAVEEPWAQPLHFPTPDHPPAPTLKDRVMVGYQGWFRTPNDRDDNGWFHWFHSKSDASPEFYTFDMWPDTRAYPGQDRARAGNIRTRGGHPAFLYSATSQAVVRKQFAWMRENHVDGAFLQRFLSDHKAGEPVAPEWVLMNVRKAANAEKRLWAVEYDVSGMRAATACETLKRDWSRLTDVLRVTDDPYYARENGKPVVFVWGLPFPDRKFTPEAADQIVDFFKNDPAPHGGNYVIGSLPNVWQGLSPEWLAHARKYDGMQVWQTHDYAVDQQACNECKQDYYPHVWPGFSWAHLTKKQDPAAFTDRAGGTYYRSRISQAFAAGCDRLFVGMFDEYDEGTAILPMTDDPPLPGAPAGRFLTNGEDPPNLWLRITGEAEEALKTASPAQAFSEAK